MLGSEESETFDVSQNSAAEKVYNKATKMFELSISMRFRLLFPSTPRQTSKPSSCIPFTIQSINIMSSTGVPGGVWFYIPNQGAAIFFAIVFALFGCTITYYAFRGGIRRFFWVVMIGIVMEVGGFACRAVARHNLDQIVRYSALLRRSY